MPTTLTIKQVPDQLAARLRRRAAANRRSLQRELLLIVERAAEEAAILKAAEPAPPVYRAHPTVAGKAARKPASKPVSGRLSLETLWQRAHKLGVPMLNESTAIVRRDRDARSR